MSDNSSAPTVPGEFILPRASTVIGPVFVGNAVNCVLMGTLVVQVYLFYVNFPRERLRIRLLVYGIFLLDILQTLFGIHLAWDWMITNWNNPDALAHPISWTDATIPIMCGLVAGIVQLFYAWQIWALAKSVFMHAVAALIVVVALGQSSASIISSSLLLKSLTPEEFKRLFPGFEFWLAGSFVADILISCSMIWILYNAKTETVWMKSETLFSRLIVNTIRTGSVTVVCATIDLALFVALPDGNYHLAPAYILGKLYSNSLMATLNARKLASRASVSQSDSVGMTPRSLAFAKTAPSMGSSQVTTRAFTTVSKADSEASISKERAVRVLSFNDASAVDIEDGVDAAKSGGGL
ncbi:hypothetical protein BV25DRAFT_1912663 [Artomyces pyxidatus]|uniref:Uncharacterized protein n=1 Tax=Artomyces pyxidatus TaxID=48021 RepID=A0ACB8TDX1_9AGAM|nr:hypothetical protein BV25DRAFT_1912663 [Artomyces pyxidatus]